MIGITTDNGTLLIAAEIPIPEGQNWSATRIQRLIAMIERHVFDLEEADHADNHANRDNLLSRKPNFKSGLVIDA